MNRNKAHVSSVVNQLCSFSSAAAHRRLPAAFAMAPLPNFPNAPLIIILLMIPHLLLVTVSGFYMPIHSAPPPSQPACDPWSRSHSSHPPPDICTNPTFDAAVSVSDSQMLLFKGAHMWILDLINYQVSQPLNNCFLQSCFGGRKTPSITRTRGNFSERAGYAERQQLQSPQPYYVWNQHEKLRFYRHRICMQGADEICPFAVDLRQTSTNNGLHWVPAAAPAPAAAAAAATAASSAPFAARNGSRSGFEHRHLHHFDQHGDELCRENVNGGSNGDIIEIMLTRRNFNRQPKDPQVAILVGRHFKAYVMYTPSPYDKDLVFFKVELHKLYQVVQERRGRQEPGNEPSSGLEATEEDEMPPVRLPPKQRLIENVNTFAIMPNGNVIIFFADHFCIINYYNLECLKQLRPTSDLLGCDMPDSEYEVSPNQLNIVAPDRMNTSSQSENGGKRQSEEKNQPTATTAASASENARGKEHDSAADSSQANETDSSSVGAISDASSSRLDSSPANTTTTTISSTPFPTAVPSSSSAPSTGNEQYSSGVSTLRHQDNDNVTTQSSAAAGAGATSTTLTSSSSSPSSFSSLSPELSLALKSTVAPSLSGEGEKQDGSSNSQQQQQKSRPPSSAETATATITNRSITRAEHDNSGRREDSHSSFYDIDFLYRKRDAVKRSPTHDPAELYFGNLSRRFAFLWTGCASLLTIGNRAFNSFFIAFAVTHLLAVLLLSFFHRFKRIDFTVLLYIYFFSLGRIMTEY